MATGAGRGHTPAAPTGGTGTPTETSRPPQGHRHSHGDTGILTWIRGHRDLTGGTGTPRGISAPTRGHGGTGALWWHRHKGIPTGGSSCSAPSSEFPVPPPCLPGLKPPQGCSVAAAGAGVSGSGPPEGRAEGSSAGCVGRRGEWAASTVLPQGKPVEIPPLCEAAGPCPEGFLVRAVISVTANYPAPAGRAGSARGGPRARPRHIPSSSKWCGKGGRQSCSLRHSQVYVQTQTRRVGVRVHTQKTTRACTHRCVWDTPKYVHRIHTHTQTCGAQTQPQVQAHNRGTHGWMHIQVHTHVYTYTHSCTHTPCPAHQHVCPGANTALPAPYGVGLEGPDPSAHPQAFRELKASPSSSSSGEGSNPGEHA